MGGHHSLILFYVLIDHEVEGLFGSSAHPVNHLYFQESPSELRWASTINVAPSDFITGILAPKVWGTGQGLIQAACWVRALIQPETQQYPWPCCETQNTSLEW